MKARHLAAISRRIFQGIRHDKRTMAMIGIVPVAWMCVFGFAFSGDVKNVKVVVVNQDRGYSMGTTNVSIAATIVDKLQDDILRITEMDDPEQAIQQVKEGRSDGVIIFPANFTLRVLSRLINPRDNEQASISVRTDDSNVNIASTIKKRVADALLEAMNASGYSSPVNVDTSEPIYAKNARFVDAFVPGVVAFATYLVATLLTLISFVSERTTGTLERLLSTPLTEGEIVGGYALAFGLISILQVSILLGVAIVAFDVMIVGDVGLAFVIAALLAVVGQSLGILLSSAARRELQAVQFFPLIVIPAFLLSGVFWPIEAIPAWLRPASYLIPTTYAVEALRSVMLRGWGLERIGLDLATLAAFASFFLTLAVVSLRRGRR